MPLTPTLPDDILEEIFLRLPPDEPEWLVRASLASKPWLGLLTGTAFQGRYREFHGAPPVLGFLCSSTFDYNKKHPDPLFVSTGNFSPRSPQGMDWGPCYGYSLWDCRHGRVLLGNTRWEKDSALTVWDPMTGRHSELDAPGPHSNGRAAVLCSVTGCDHKACHDGPFRVVFVGLQRDGACVAYTHDVSLPPQMGRGWSEPCSHLHLPDGAFFDPRPPVLTAEDALYFIVLDVEYYEGGDEDENITILRYDLGSNCLSPIEAPLLEISTDGDIVLMAMEDGSLGFARVNMLTLYLWSRQVGSNGWTACGAIDLDEFLPIGNPKTQLRLIGSVEGTDIVFVTTDLGIYEISLRSLEWKKIWKTENFHALVPYISFYDPIERADPCDAAR